MTGPSPIFQLWEDGHAFTREQVLVDCPAYDDFRRSLNRLAKVLIDTEDDRAEREIFTLLRLRHETECTPVFFDQSLLDRIAAIGGGSDSLRMQWGMDVSRLHASLARSGEQLVQYGNAIHQTLESKIGRLEGQSMIWCHRTHAESFRATVGAEVPFIHSPSVYRTCPPFRNLVLLGGLRNTGFGRVPESLVIAPRFRHLVQVMWGTDEDDPDFGMSATFLNFDPGDFWRINKTSVECGHEDCGTRKPLVDADPDAEIVSEWAEKHATHRRTVSNATLLTLGAGTGAVFRSGTHVMVFDVVAHDVVGKDAREVEEGDILLSYEGEIDFGEVAESDHPLVRKWRNDMREAWEADKAAFLSRLRQNGIKLKGLPSCVSGWMNNRRPQLQDTLERVCFSMGWDKKRARQLWRLFSKQHGKAVQEGTIESELEREEVENRVRTSGIVDKLATLPAGSQGTCSFDLPIDEDMFVLNAYVVDGIDAYESVDENMIGKFMDLAEFQP